MIAEPSREMKTKTTAAPLRCDHCHRLISKWVSDLGYTINVASKNFCRFCYLKLRNAGKIQPKTDDADFISGINWELSMAAEVTQKHNEAERIAAAAQPETIIRAGLKTVVRNVPERAVTARPAPAPQGRVKPLPAVTSKQQAGLCPACRSRLSFNIRGHANAEGICPKCNSHIQLLSSGTIKLVPARAAIIMSVARRTGASLESVEEIYSYVVDEIAARLSEHPILGIPELGTFKVSKTGKPCAIAFKPSRRLIARIATHNIDAENKVSRLFTGTQVHKNAPVVSKMPGI